MILVSISYLDPFLFIYSLNYLHLIRSPNALVFIFIYSLLIPCLSFSVFSLSLLCWNICIKCGERSACGWLRRAIYDNSQVQLEAETSPIPGRRPGDAEGPPISIREQAIPQVDWSFQSDRGPWEWGINAWDVGGRRDSSYMECDQPQVLLQLNSNLVHSS